MYRELTRKIATKIISRLLRISRIGSRKKYCIKGNAKDVHPKYLLRKLNRTKKRNDNGEYIQEYIKLRDQLWLKFEKLAYEVVHRHFSQEQYPKISLDEKLQEARIQLLYLLDDGAFITKMIKSKYEPSTIIFTKLREILAEIFNLDDYKMRTQFDPDDEEQLSNLQEV